MIGTLDKKFWEDQKLWYKCIDEKNEGIIVEKGSQVRFKKNFQFQVLPFMLSGETRGKQTKTMYARKMENLIYP